uniref:DNA 3'-5' helicase n=1 Tax=Cyanothece sp. (strain PCC 7425 / ATCC 29141) TaxID=395961 RepID=B8HYW2_CYAP4
MPWLTTMKPTFQTEWLALPPKESHQILEKINLLTYDPTPDAKVKKQLKYMGGKLHRLRSGNYRIFYTFDNTYVSLLALRRRDDDTYDEDLDAEFLGGLDPTLETQTHQPNWDKLFGQPQAQETPLPEPITIELLTNLRIPEVCHARLLRVESREKLFDCPGIPDQVILKLDEYLFERPLVEVLQQPDFLTGNLDNLLKFKEGDLLGFLLKLNPEQERFVTWGMNATGPTLVKGGPGTGKSTVALYRVRTLIQTLKANGIAEPKVLFTTYTNALIAFSRQLLTSLLGDDIQHVNVDTVDSIIYALVCREAGEPKLADANQLKILIQQARELAVLNLEGNLLQQHAQKQILENLTPDYLLEEMGRVIEGRGLESLEDYQATPRAGRTVALNKVQRQAIWTLRCSFYQLLEQAGLETWEQLRSRAVKLLQNLETPILFDAVVIDEAQDLDPNALRFLTLLCRAPNRLFVTADANQSIYSSGFRWTDIHADLRFNGRTGVLRTNHRTTREVNEAALHYLADGSLDQEIPQHQYIHNGPQPAVRAISNRGDEADLLVRFCKVASREFRLGINACAILVPSERAGRKLAEQLNYRDLPSTYMTSKDLDLNCAGVKILTLQSAKGLEFPIVAIAGFLESTFPTIAKGTPETELDEIFYRARRTLFVGMTRAMRALLLLVPDKNTSPVLQNFAPHLWNLGTTA